MSLKTRAANYTATSGAPPAGLSDRDALLEAHLPQVKYIAERLAAKLPPSVDRDDLIGAGVLGLLDAVDKYDPSRGVLFKTYAEMRVRGAMLDSLRDLDWAPRSMRQRAREVEAASREIEQRLGRVAEEEEVAAALSLSVGEFHTLLQELRGLNVTGLDGEDEDETGVRARQVLDDPARTPLALYEGNEVRDRLASAVDRLPERERQIVALYYVEELTMKEIGAVLGVTESRVSQIHTQAVIRLRAALAPMRAAGALAY
jgi:RNA polymerase sigma factor for flagellar operon FliA